MTRVIGQVGVGISYSPCEGGIGNTSPSGTRREHTPRFELRACPASQVAHHGEVGLIRAGAVLRSISAKAHNEAAAQAAAAASAARWKPIKRRFPREARMKPSNAVAIMVPVRATALFRPVADPMCRASTDASTAVVRGATAALIPKAMTDIIG